MAENPTAFWTIELECDCPKCKKFVDLTDADEFWEGKGNTFEVLNWKDQWVTCPECGHEFKCDFEH